MFDTLLRFARTFGLAALWLGFGIYGYHSLANIAPTYKLLSVTHENRPPAKFPVERLRGDSRLQDRVARIEAQLFPRYTLSGENPRRRTVVEAMREYNVPALAVAVIDKGNIEWTRAYGLLRADRSEPATSNMVFQAGSVTKPTVAAMVLALADHGQIALDADVNTLLKDWKLPGQWPHLPTVRQLLNHTAGVNVYGGRGGYLPQGPVPTLTDLLQGRPPANTDAVRVVQRPGSEFHYSNGGYMALRKLLIDVTGKDLQQLAPTSLFLPAGMIESTYAPVPDVQTHHVASGHSQAGAVLPGQWRLIPEGLLWTTAPDLANFVLAIQRSWRGEPGSLLSQGIAREMLAPGVAPWGLGFQLKGEGGDLAFLHAGSTPGYKAFIMGYPYRGQGAVILTNSDRGMEVGEMLLTSIADEYGWPHYRSRVFTRTTLDAAALAEYAGEYRMTPESSAVFTVENGQLIGKVRDTGNTPLEPIGPARFFSRDGSTFDFKQDARGRVTAVVVDDWLQAKRINAAR